MFKIQRITGHTLDKMPIVMVVYAESLLGARYVVENFYDDMPLQWEPAMGGHMAKYDGTPIALILKY